MIFEPGQHRQAQLRHVAVGEEDVAQHVHGHGVAPHDVGQREHRVFRDRVGGRRIGVDLDADEVRTAAPHLVLHHIDQPVDPGGSGRGDTHDVTRDLGHDVWRVRGDRGDTQRAAIRIRVICEHLHRHGVSRPGHHVVGNGDRIARALRARRDTHTNCSGRPRAQRVDNRISEGVRAGRVFTRQVVEVVDADIRHRSLFGVGLLPEQLHRVAVRVDTGERDADAHGLTSGDPCGHGLGDRGHVRRLDRLANGDVHLRLSHLTIGALNLIDGGEVSRAVRREVSQHVTRGEEQPRTGGDTRGEFWIEAERLPVGMHVIVENGNVDGVAHPHGDNIVVSNRGLVAKRSGYLDDRDTPLRVGETVRDEITETHRSVVQRGGERDAHGSLIEHRGGDARSLGNVRNTGNQQNAIGRVDIARGDVDGLLPERSHEDGFRDGDRGRVRFRRRRDIHTHDAGGGLIAVVDHIFQIVGAHLIAGELESTGLEARFDRCARFAGNTAEAQYPRTAAHVRERVDGDLLTRVCLHREGIGNDRHVAIWPHGD